MSTEDILKGAAAERRRIIKYLKGVNEREDKKKCPHHPILTTPCNTCDGKRKKIYYFHDAAHEIDKALHMEEPEDAEDAR